MKKIFFFSLFYSLFLFSNVQAAEPVKKIQDPSYSAKFYSQSEKDPITIEAGKSKTIIINFKNIGTATWDSNSTHYLSAYVVDSNKNTPVFKGANWLSNQQTAKVTGRVKSGQIGELKLDLVAPTKVGRYTKEFYLSSENNTWIKGGYFFIKIKVVKAETPTKITSTVLETETSSKNTVNNYQAQLVGINFKQVVANGGDQIRIIATLQNTGKNVWKNYQIVFKPATTLASVDSLISFVDESWQNSSVVKSDQQEVSSGEFLRSEFNFRTPVKSGVYTASFKYQIDGQEVEGGEIIIPVTVTNNAPNYVNNNIDLSNNTQMLRLAAEPRIRVGIWKPTDFVQFRSAEDDYQVYDGVNLVGVLPRNNLGVFSREAGMYTFHGGTLDIKTPNYIRLVPINNSRAVFELLNFNHYVKWKGPNNFNRYRGAVEYRLSENGTIWLINDLLFEDYIKGIGETSGGANYEFLKTSMVAARSYAYYIQQATDKHADRNFDVSATTGDQLYLGVESEELMPRVAQAAEETRGEMVTYNDQVVITPYFGHSNGKTKSWVQVWGGTAKPWLVPVKCEYDKGLKQYGHGVGMSQLDASKRAEKEGLDYVSLLKHYYTGTEVQKIY